VDLDISSFVNSLDKEKASERFTYFQLLPTFRHDELVSMSGASEEVRNQKRKPKNKFVVDRCCSVV
jgi:hypothetical protein